MPCISMFHSMPSGPDCSQPHAYSIPTGCCNFVLWSSPSTSFPMCFLDFTETGEDLTLTGLAKLLRFLGGWGVIRQHQGHSGREKVRSDRLGEWKRTRSMTFRGCQEAEDLQTPSLKIIMIFVACSMSPPWLKPCSYAPIFLRRLGCSQYILLPRCLVHYFAVSTEKSLHIFCCQTAAKVEHLRNLQVVSLMFLGPDKSILDVGMPLTWEVQHVTSKKA